jgi:hypothetical protein
LRVIPNAAVPGRFVVTGERAGLALSGVVDTARRGECAPGEIWVSVGAHEVAQAAATTGAVGPQRHRRLRLPVVPQRE